MTKEYLQNKIGEFFSRSDIVSEDLYLVMAQAMIERSVRPKAMERIATLTVAGGEGKAPLPTDYVVLGTISDNVGRYASPEEAHTYLVQGNTEQRHSIIGTDLYTFPNLPDGTQITIFYQARIPKITTDNPTNVVLTNAFDIYFWATAFVVADMFGNSDKASLYEERFTRKVNEYNQSETLSKIPTTANVPSFPFKTFQEIV